jgi:sterol desaturase/sphingolipid hydroxylase (fatty acid hydroxylase superfamily)
LRSLVPTLLFVGLVLTASHSRFLRRWNAVHQVMKWAWLTTPHEHLLHHAVDSRSNYGNFTTLWDRVFGTYEDPIGKDLEQVPLGLSYDQDFLGTVTLGRLHFSPAQRTKYQVARYCNLEDGSENS